MTFNKNQNYRLLLQRSLVRTRFNGVMSKYLLIISLTLSVSACGRYTPLILAPTGKTLNGTYHSPPQVPLTVWFDIVIEDNKFTYTERKHYELEWQWVYEGRVEIDGNAVIFNYDSSKKEDEVYKLVEINGHTYLADEDWFADVKKPKKADVEHLIFKADESQNH